MPSRYIQIHVSCKDLEEADAISRQLLDERLIACAKTLPIQSRYWWDGNIEAATEVLLMLETVRERLAAVRIAIENAHSYDLPFIQVIDVEVPDDKAKEWIETNARG